ncbi:unnamed protein product [Caenorhabditis sp. 36 PRJEB53466]|nr:unnamed protein product [Caenorhabditis sp. 36 PRJEB53466]
MIRLSQAARLSLPLASALFLRSRRLRVRRDAHIFVFWPEHLHAALVAFSRCAGLRCLINVARVANAFGLSSAGRMDRPPPKPQTSRNLELARKEIEEIRSLIGGMDNWRRLQELNVAPGEGRAEFNKKLEKMKLERDMRLPATFCEIRSLCKYLRDFKFWPFLPVDCKREIVKNMDLKTQGAISCTAREEYWIVKKMPLYIFYMNIEYKATLFVDEPNTRVRLIYSMAKDLPWKFVDIKFTDGSPRSEFMFRYCDDPMGIYGHSTIKYFHDPHHNRRRKTRRDLWQTCTFFLRMALDRCHSKITKLSVNVNQFPFKQCGLTKLPETTHFQIKVNEDDMSRWIAMLPDKLVEFHASGRMREFVTSDTPQIMNVQHFYLNGRSEVTDEQFAGMAAGTIRFAMTKITEKGIHAFLKKWADDVDDKNKLTEAYICMAFNPEAAVKDLWAFEWDAVFIKEHEDFYEKMTEDYHFGRMFQVLSSKRKCESITVIFGPYETSIVRTGFKQDGVMMTEYRFPEKYENPEFEKRNPIFRHVEPIYLENSEDY